MRQRKHVHVVHTVRHLVRDNIGDFRGATSGVQWQVAAARAQHILGAAVEFRVEARKGAALQREGQELANAVRGEGKGVRWVSNARETIERREARDFDILFCKTKAQDCRDAARISFVFLNRGENE